MQTGLKGKSALITGGSSGIGLGIAQVLAEEGVRLAVASRNPDPGALEALRQAGAEAHAICADLGLKENVDRMVREAAEALGGIDLYVNNAAWTWHQSALKIDPEAWENTINTNLSACVWACKAVCAHMIERGDGAVVIIGSTSRFNPAYAEAAYRVSKTGLYVYMQTLALEMAAWGIRVNMVTPGHFKTRMTGGLTEGAERNLLDMIPLHRFGAPREVGNAVALMLSDELSGYTTGSDIVVDGGLSLNPIGRRTVEEIRSL